jgi:hypothetical protein
VVDKFRLQAAVLAVLEEELMEELMAAMEEMLRLI